MLKIKKETYIILFLNIVVTLMWRGQVTERYEAVQALAKGKTPVTIIMYHSILKDEGSAGTYVITPQQFENDIKYLKENGYNFITMDDLIGFVNKKWSKLPAKPVMITFDDGYYNNYLYAYPIAKKYEACFVLSVLGVFTDMNIVGEKMNERYSHVTWEQIKEMEKSGIVDIQNHSFDLHSTSKGRAGSTKKSGETPEQYKKFLTADIMKLQELLKKNSGVTANTFTYPFGRISPESVDILKELGFDAALTCSAGINYIGKGDTELLLSLKRYNRPYGKSSESFFKGKLEP